jgi:hypothetical protein
VGGFQGIWTAVNVGWAFYVLATMARCLLLWKTSAAGQDKSGSRQWINHNVEPPVQLQLSSEDCAEHHLESATFTRATFDTDEQEETCICTSIGSLLVVWPWKRGTAGPYVLTVCTGPVLAAHHVPGRTGAFVTLESDGAVLHVPRTKSNTAQGIADGL